MEYTPLLQEVLLLFIEQGYIVSKTKTGYKVEGRDYGTFNGFIQWTKTLGWRFGLVENYDKKKFIGEPTSLSRKMIDSLRMIQESSRVKEIGDNDNTYHRN